KSRKAVLRLAYSFLLKSCFEDMAAYIPKLPKGEHISVVCEELAGVEGMANETFLEYKKAAELDEVLGGITFLPKKKFRGLQAADMLAYENFKHVTNQFIKDEARPVRRL